MVDLMSRRYLTCVSFGMMGALLGFGVIFDAWGSRGIKDEHSFQYRGNSASIKRDDRILDYDKYWIQVGEDRIFDGELVADDGRKIYIGNSVPGAWIGPKPFLIR